MLRILLALLSMGAVLALGFDASAQSKRCPKGYYYDEEIGKCVPRRGSY
jgi:hypothetical protein